ncbi:MAG: pyridoxal phosphate-dependent aminotransferase [Gammaproteobacteria bacterium]|nr:pyridoxal phosphate-dependent aminotransferase [Gammaproteobacteria bacterium]
MNELPPVAERMSEIRPFYVMELLARARELEGLGLSIIHMEVGEPDFPTPGPVVEAGKQALDADFTHYTPALGIPELRQAIADFYGRQFGITVDSGRVMVTPGSSGGLQLVTSVLLNPGDGLLMADPGYPCNRHFVQLVGGEPQLVAVDGGSRYQLSAALVAENWRGNTKGVLVATPANPTGTTLSMDELRAIYQVVKERGGLLIVDEIYSSLVYGMDPQTALSIADDILVINSFSKYFGMTGWRLGWIIAPGFLVDAIDRLAQNIFLSPPTPSQYAALAAFGEDTLQILEQRRQMFCERRDYLLPELKTLGFEFPVVPEGAFYLYGRCDRLTDDSYRFAMALLEQEGVAVTPGRDFGDNQPEKHLRFAYTTDIEKLKEGVARIRRFIG